MMTDGSMDITVIKKQEEMFSNNSRTKLSQLSDLTSIDAHH